MRFAQRTFFPRGAVLPPSGSTVTNTASMWERTSGRFTVRTHLLVVLSSIVK